MSPVGMVELFCSEVGTYQDSRLRQGIRRVFDLQFKGIQEGFQLTCRDCKKHEVTNKDDPVFLTGFVDTSTFPPVASARLQYNDNFICKDCRRAADKAKANEAAGAEGAHQAAVPILTSAAETSPVAPMGTADAPSTSNMEAAKAALATSLKTVGRLRGSTQRVPVSDPVAPSTAPPPGAASQSGGRLVAGRGRGPISEEPVTARDRSSAPLAREVSISPTDLRALDQGVRRSTASGAPTAAGPPSGPPPAGAATTDVGAGVGNSTTPLQAQQHHNRHHDHHHLQQVGNGLCLKEYFEVRSLPLKGKGLHEVSVDLVFSRSYLFSLGQSAAGANDPAGPAASEAAEVGILSHLLSRPEDAATMATKCSKELTPAEIQRLQSLDFSVPNAALRTLSHVLLAIADWVLAPQALEFVDTTAATATATAATVLLGKPHNVSNAASTGRASLGGRASTATVAAATATTVGATQPAPSPPGGVLLAQLRPWAFAVRVNQDVLTHGTCLRPSLQCLGGRALGKPPTSLLEVLNSPPLTFSLAREALGVRRNKPLASVIGSGASPRTQSSRRGSGFRLRPGWVLPLQRLTALLSKRNKWTQEFRAQLPAHQLGSWLGELLQGDVFYDIYSGSRQPDQDQQDPGSADMERDAKAACAGGSNGTKSAAAAAAGGTTTSHHQLRPVDAFLWDLGATRQQVREALMLEDVDENVGFCVECGHVGALVACDSCVDSFCNSCLGQDPECLPDVWRCRYCQRVFPQQVEGTTAAVNKAYNKKAFPKSAAPAAPAVASGKTAYPAIKQEPIAIGTDDSHSAGTDDDDTIGTGTTGSSSEDPAADGNCYESKGKDASLLRGRHNNPKVVSAGGGSDADGNNNNTRDGRKRQYSSEPGWQKAVAHHHQPPHKLARLTSLRHAADRRAMEGAGDDDEQNQALEDVDAIEVDGAAASGSGSEGLQQACHTNHKRNRHVLLSEDVEECGAAGHEGEMEEEEEDLQSTPAEKSSAGGGQSSSAGVTQQQSSDDDHGEAPSQQGDEHPSTAADDEQMDVEMGEAAAGPAADGKAAAGRRGVASDGEPVRSHSSSSSSDEDGSHPVDDTKGMDEGVIMTATAAVAATEAAVAGRAATGNQRTVGSRANNRRKHAEADYEPSTEGDEDDEDTEDDGASSGATSDYDDDESDQDEQQPQQQQQRVFRSARRSAQADGGSSEGTSAGNIIGTGTSTDSTDVEVVGEVAANPAKRGRRGRGRGASRGHGRMGRGGRHSSQQHTRYRVNRPVRRVTTQQRGVRSNSRDTSSSGGHGDKALADGGLAHMQHANRGRRGRPPRLFKKQSIQSIVGNEKRSADKPIGGSPMDDKDAAAALMMLNINTKVARSDDDGLDGGRRRVSALLANQAPPEPEPQQHHVLLAAGEVAQPHQPTEDIGNNVAILAANYTAAAATVIGGPSGPSAAATVAAGHGHVPQSSTHTAAGAGDVCRNPAILQQQQQVPQPQGQQEGEQQHVTYGQQHSNLQPEDAAAVSSPSMVTLAGGHLHQTTGVGDLQQPAAAAGDTTCGLESTAGPGAGTGAGPTAVKTESQTPPSGIFTKQLLLSKKEAVKAGCRVFEYAAGRGVDAGLLAQWTATLSRVLKWYDRDSEVRDTLKSCLNGLTISSTPTMDLSNLECMIRAVTKMLEDSVQEATAATAGEEAAAAADSAS